jgi:hypothetical protein
MIRTGLRGAFLAGLAGVGAMGCQTTAEPRLARLEEATPQDMAMVRRVLSEAVGRAQIELGPMDLTRAPVVSVLPPPLGPLEGASPAMPEIFELVAVGEGCFLRRRRDGAMFALTDVRCVGLEGPAGGG